MQIFKYGQREIQYLKERDRILGAAIDRIGMIERAVIPDLFTALINSIVGQQISSKAAETVWNRLVEKIGCITPENIAAASPETIQQCGMSGRKVRYIKDIAKAVIDRKVDLQELQNKSDDEVINCLSSLNEIGKWTAEMLLIFSMERPDVVSRGDLGIRRRMIKLYGLETLSKEEFN